MVFRKKDLIPTQVMRSDGHMTTVHKKSVDSPVGLKVLNAAKPTVAPAVKVKKRKKLPESITVKWSTQATGSSYVQMNTGAGIVPSLIGPKKDVEGEAEVKTEDVYALLRFGVKSSEAGLLLQHAPLEHWLNNEKFHELTPGGLIHRGRGNSYGNYGIGKAVDFLRENNVPVGTAERILTNGFKDDHLDRALTADQTIEVFKRFSYSESIDESKKTEAGATVDALLDGVIPWEAFEAGVRKPVMGEYLSALVNQKERYSITLTEEEQFSLYTNHDLVLKAMTKRSEDKSAGTFREIYASLLNYGEEATEKYGAQILAMSKSNGERMGVDGAEKITQYRDYLKNDLQFPPSQFSDTNVVFVDRDNNRVHRVSYDDVLDLIEAGSYERVTELLDNGNLNSKQALAVLKGDSSPTLVSGWL